MYFLRVAQKLLFIANICWVMGLVFRIISLNGWPDFLVKSILVTGLLIALPLGIVWYGITLILLWYHKIRLWQVSRWLFIVNLIFIPVILMYRFL